MKRSIGIIGVLFVATAILMVVGRSAQASSGTTERVSVATDGSQGNGGSYNPSISADGRYIAFYSDASSLVAADTNVYTDVFVRDQTADTTERVSVSSAGAQANGHSYWASVSADGRYVAFCSLASNLVPTDTNGRQDVFVRDRIAGTTECVSVSSAGVQANGHSSYPAISPDGRYVAFQSGATNLVLSDTNSIDDIFVRDRVAGTTERVSVAADASQAGDTSYEPSISADGRYVAFHSWSTRLVASDTNHAVDVFVRDRILSTTERVSVASDGTQGNDHSGVGSLSAGGRYVAFVSGATNLVLSDTNVYTDVFVRDQTADTTERVSVSSDGTQGNGVSWGPNISADGRYVAFLSSASNLVPGDTNVYTDVFVHDRITGSTERVSVGFDGSQANRASYDYYYSSYPSISTDGRYVAFPSGASNLVPGDTNGEPDIFVRDRSAAPTLGTVVGRVDLQGHSNDGGALVALMGSVYTTTTAADGSFAITDVAAGTYTATVSMPGYLSAMRTGVVAADGVTTTLPPVKLLGGDADNDGGIGIYDLTVLGANFGLMVPPGDARADINGDGAVNIFDLVLVGANYGLAAPRPWP